MTAKDLSMDLRKDITNREMFHEVMGAYIEASERDAEHIASGRRGWTPAAKSRVHYMGTLSSYAVRAVKRGHSVAKAMDALAAGDAALCSYFCDLLWADKSLHAQWVEALQLNQYKGE